MQSSAAETCLRDPAALASSCVFIEVLRDLPHQPTSANFRQNRDGHIQAAHRQQACLWHIQSRRGSQIFFCFPIVNLQKLACGGRNDSIDVFDNVQDLFDFLVGKWHFRWNCDSAKKNGVEEFEEL